MKAAVVGISATFRRPMELARLAASLGALEQPLHGWVIVDNGGDVDWPRIAELSKTTVAPIKPAQNLGCGAALQAAELQALEKFGASMTHLWILDDDAVAEPDSLEALLEAMAREDADAACPAVTNEAGEVAWLPGLLDHALLRRLTAHQITPGEFLREYGEAARPFSWAQGIALLVTRRALEENGPHRTDYWVRGEDLEFSLRITHRRQGLFVPRAVVAHLPPVSPGKTGPPSGEYEKHLAMLQNIAYTSMRLPHGRPILRTIPGNALRFWRTWGFNLRAIFDVARVLGKGAILARPAGR